MKRKESLACRARNFSEIAVYYGVSTKVVRSWLRQRGVWEQLRRKTGYYYTPAELSRIEAVLGSCDSQTNLFG
jgi:uncharacterized protein YjcR